MKVKVGVSNRHVHLNQEALDLLFGKKYELTVRNKLSQENDFACNETVTLTPSIFPFSVSKHLEIIG